MLAGLVPVILMQQSYSREAETEADRFAIDFLNKNNIDLNNFSSVLAKITQAHKSETYDADDESSQINNYLSSHPETEERIESIKTYNETSSGHSEFEQSE